MDTDGKGMNRTRLIEPRLHRTDGKGMGDEGAAPDTR
jgi:hypothetical protein